MLSSTFQEITLFEEKINKIIHFYDGNIIKSISTPASIHSNDVYDILYGM